MSLYAINILTGEIREGKQTNPKYFAESTHGIVWFFQDTKPTNTDQGFWKLENGIVIDKTTSEIEVILQYRNYLHVKNTEFLGFRYRVECPWPYIEDNYPNIANWCRSKKGIDTDISDTGTSKAYFNVIIDNFRPILENDPNFTIFDAETLNPYNVQ